MDVSLLNEFVRLMRRIDILGEDETRPFGDKKTSWEELSMTKVNLTAILIITFIDVCYGSIAMVLMVQMQGEYCAQPIPDFLGIYGLLLIIMNVFVIFLLCIVRGILHRIEKFRESRDRMTAVVESEHNNKESDELSDLSSDEENGDQTPLFESVSSDHPSKSPAFPKGDFRNLYSVYSCCLCFVVVPVTTLAFLLFILGNIWIHNAHPGAGQDDCSPIVVEKSRVFLYALYIRVGFSVVVQLIQFCPMMRPPRSRKGYKPILAK